jgi:ABC-2 type transport system ATP-binding protein
LLVDAGTAGTAEPGRPYGIPKSLTRPAPGPTFALDSIEWVRLRFEVPMDDASIIEVAGLTKTFDGFTAVDHISFGVTKGEIFGFLGPNGAGKTTTIKMLTTLLRPSGGSIRLGGHDAITEPQAVRRSFGIVFQDPSLDDELTARENMEFHGVLYKVPRATRRARTEDLLRMLGLWERKDDLVKHFSGGMKRRLEIARGLLHHPGILFLDEPTLGLDPQTRESIWNHIKDLNRTKGITVFFTTHYMDEADRVASRLAIIDRGIIVADGAPDAIKRQTGRGSLEEAFIALTGSRIRDDSPAPFERMRMRRRLWRR